MWGGGNSSSGSSLYPPIHSPTDHHPEPSAPPLELEAASGQPGFWGQQAPAPAAQQQQHAHWPFDAAPAPQQQQPADVSTQALPPGKVLVATPAIEPQPWVKDLWQNLAARTVGVARVDLRRPTFPWPEDYDPNNILFRHHKRGRGRPRKHQQQPIVGFIADQQQQQQYLPAGLAPGGGQQQPYRQQPTGARLKVTRCLQLKAPESKRALLDFGVGVGVDLDRQELHGVARLKVADLLSIKLLPRPLLKLGGAWSLPGTGMALRVKYELPLAHIGEFWAPPARLMVRLDNDVGTGVHLTPTGVEFDERRLTLGSSTELRAGATLRFPRALPVDRDDPNAFRLQVHRLSLKTLW